MPSRSLSNLNTAFSLGFRRALTEVSLSRKNYPCKPLSGGATSQVLRNSGNQRYRNIMMASNSIVPSGDLVVDALVSGCGDMTSFVKPGSVFYSKRSNMMCGKAMVSMSNGYRESLGGRGCFMRDFKPFYSLSKGMSDGRTFSSLCHSDGVVPEVSKDGSIGIEHLSSLALSTEKIPSKNTVKLLSGACYWPHPAKVETGGEDAHFICVDEQVIGVADGVGGWADVGVNAGEYARELMDNSVRAIRESPDSDVDPLLVLEKAHAATNAMGSSTACIVALKDQDIHAINLGDSGFIIVRGGHTIFESPVQQHGFNFTYQLERSNRSDPPSSGQVFKISVAPGDVVVAGSDGLFDNLYNKEIAAIVGDAVREGLGPDATAEKIATIARARALDKKMQTPFSMAAQQAGFTYYGGKLDDLTVVVSFVSAPIDA
ncbi:probable protein phosphatase 2C 80 isoform X2 [Andrographis paniculata]|uniref:probable protein phosphatase 2C 80 isoform X2 n=1 Tax=Andrographis paniculata TaxID=175694 RepID=UPI0021E6F4BD|nr:probable protein phosphatase 2C 80 isoform X2 [Andrographis paniculata]